MVIDPNDLSAFDNTPDETLYGLSSRDLLALCHFPFMKSSPIKIRPDIHNEVLDQLPFFRLCEHLLAIVAPEKGLKLTTHGNLPLAIVKELYTKGKLNDPLVETGIIKRWREQEIMSIAAARQVCTMAGLIKKRNNRLSLTKQGHKLRTNRQALLSKVLITHAYDFFTSQFDGYPDHATGQFGSHVVWYLLLKYGSQSRPTRFYAEKYQTLFPDLLTPFGSPYASPFDQFCRCFEIRTFTRFNDWWGFTETTEYRFGEIATTKRTEYLQGVLEFVR